MFDISFTELMIIGIVALVVIGPERLPKVARTLGHLLGRAQRYVNDVKTDIKREMDAGDLNDVKNQFTEAASSVKASIEDASRTIEDPMKAARDAVENAGKSLQSSLVDFDGYEPDAAAKEAQSKALADNTSPANNANGNSGASGQAQTPQAQDSANALHNAPESTSAPEDAKRAAAAPAASSNSNTGTTP